VLPFDVAFDAWIAAFDRHYCNSPAHPLI